MFCVTKSSQGLISQRVRTGPNLELVLGDFKICTASPNEIRLVLTLCEIHPGPPWFKTMVFVHSDLCAPHCTFIMNDIEGAVRNFVP